MQGWLLARTASVKYDKLPWHTLPSRVRHWRSIAPDMNTTLHLVASVLKPQSVNHVLINSSCTFHVAFGLRPRSLIPAHVVAHVLEHVTPSGDICVYCMPLHWMSQYSFTTYCIMLHFMTSKSGHTMCHQTGWAFDFYCISVIALLVATCDIMIMPHAEA